MLLPTYTQVFMKAMGGYVIQFFPLFLLGALFGKLMDDSGSRVRSPTPSGTRWAASARCWRSCSPPGILTYGGVSLFVVAFAVYPIGAALFREAGIPKRFIPAAIALGSFTFTRLRCRARRQSRTPSPAPSSAPTPSPPPASA